MTWCRWLTKAYVVQLILLINILLYPAVQSIFNCQSELCTLPNPLFIKEDIFFTKNNHLSLVSSSENLPIPQPTNYSLITLCGINTSEPTGVCQSRSEFGWYGVRFNMSADTNFSIVYSAKLLPNKRVITILNQLTMLSNTVYVSEFTFLELQSGSDYLLELEFVITCDQLIGGEEIALWANSIVLETWSFNVSSGVFEGIVSTNITCSFNTVTFPLPSKLAFERYLQFKLLASPNITPNSWSITLLPIQTIVRWETMIAARQNDFYPVFVTYFIHTSNNNLYYYHLNENPQIIYENIGTITEWIQFAINYKQSILTIYLKSRGAIFNNQKFTPIVDFPLTVQSFNIGSINGIFDNMFYFNDTLSAVDYWDWEFSNSSIHSEDVLLFGADYSLCNTLQFYQVSFMESGDHLVYSGSLSVNPVITTSFLCLYECTKNDLFVKNINNSGTYSAISTVDAEGSLGVQFEINNTVQNIFPTDPPITTLVYYYHQEPQISIEPTSSQLFQTPPLFPILNITSPYMRNPPYSTFFEIAFRFPIANPLPFSLTVNIINQDQPPREISLCTWIFNSTHLNLDAAEHHPSCTEISKLSDIDFDNDGYFFLPFDSSFYKTNYKIELLFNRTDLFEGALITHTMTNFLTLSKRINDIYLPYYSVFTNNRFVFSKNRFDVSKICPPYSPTSLSLDVMRFQFSPTDATLLMNCYDGFYSTDYQTYANITTPDLITIGPVNGYITSTTLISPNTQISLEDLNYYIIPPCTSSTPSISVTPSFSVVPSPTRLYFSTRSVPFSLRPTGSSPFPSNPESLSASVSISISIPFFATSSPSPLQVSISSRASASPTSFAIPPIPDDPSISPSSSFFFILPSASPISSQVVLPSLAGDLLPNDIIDIIQPVPVVNSNDSNDPSTEVTQHLNDVAYVTYSADDFVATSNNSSYVYLVIAPTPPRITADTQNYLSETDTELSSEVIDVSLIGGEVDGKVEICLKNTKAGDSKKDDSCLGYIDESTNKWKCEDRCLKNEKNDYLCGNTNHFTSFAILFNGIAKGGKCGSHDDYILNSTNEDVILSFSVLAFVCLIGLIFAIIMTMTPLKRYLYGKEGYRVYNLRKRQNNLASPPGDSSSQENEGLAS